MPLRAPFLLAAFLSSALLFVVEPLAARLVLPTFGGAPAVWNGTLLFFQAALLVGYGLAHLTATRLSPNAQRVVQPTFLFVSLLTLPLARESAFQAWVRDRAAQGGAGVALLLLALAVLVGLPFVALSVNSPLLQRWYASTGAKDADRPTFLYAAGNLGSLLALLSYPILIEANLTLGGQTTAWRWGLFLLAALVGVCAWLSAKKKARGAISEDLEGLVSATENAASSAPRIQKLRWLALAAVPSALLMGCTTYLTSNVAPIPLFWVVPLSLYLLTFILVYAAKPLAPVKILGRVYPMLVVPLAVTMLLQATTPIGPLAALHLVVFSVAAWMCHGLLAQEAPPVEGITEYWLFVSLGGALGGAFVALVAPLVFSSLAEYPLALVAAALLRPAIPRAKAGKAGGLLAVWDDRRGDLAYPLAVALVALVLILVIKPVLPPGMTRTFLLMGVPAALAFAAIDRPARFGLALGAAFWVPTALQAASDGQVLLTDRSFFGVHRVISTPAFDYVVSGQGRRGNDHIVRLGPYHELVHGNTIHGRQDLARPKDALTYYYKNGPIGSLMSVVAPPRVALVGLGVGPLAAYGRPGQKLDYFEIDPVVARIAADPRYFTFLRDSQAIVKVILGDARLTLSRAEPGYGLVVLDAFSSDSIPVHLLTVESLRMAMSKLTPQGLLAIHVSNRYLDLEPVIAANARLLHCAAMAQIDPTLPDEKAEGKTESHWILMARRSVDLDPYRNLGSAWSDLESRASVRPWTDDYSNVLGAFNPDQ